VSIALSIARTPGFSQPSSERLPSLVERLQAGEESALEEVIRETQGACARLAYSILRDSDLSRDALQEAYILVYQRIGQLREPAAFKGWLYRIVTHCCHDLLRRRQRDAALPMPGQERDVADAVGQRQDLRSAFAGLSDLDRTAIALREVCSLSYDEMARVLGIPLGTVRSRLAKARKKFIELYRGVSDE
jgi:RNA polymerase sigma-70 factor (ECF subfamily)